MSDFILYTVCNTTEGRMSQVIQAKVCAEMYSFTHFNLCPTAAVLQRQFYTAIYNKPFKWRKNIFQYWVCY